MLDYNNLSQLALEFEKRRVYGDPRDFEIFEGKADEGGVNCVVPVMSGYNYPELINDPENKRDLSRDSIKSAFREFIRYKVSHAPEGVILERIDVNKHTFHDVSNSILVSLQSYQKVIEGRKIEYFGKQDIYKKDPLLTELLNVSEQKSNIIKQMEEGRLSQMDAIKEAQPLQLRIIELESQVIKKHIELHIGKIEKTLNDNEIATIPLKLHVIPPDNQRKYGVLITSGMSAYPMMAPSMTEPIFVEMVMLLSPDWPLPLKSVERDDFYWPIEYLFKMPKYVHGNKQWFSIGHTYGNGDPPKPFAKNTDLCGFLFQFPFKELPPTFCELKIGHKPVYFLQIMPIYREEMEYIIQNGTEEFNTQLLEQKIPEYLELQRVNVFAGRKGMADNEGNFCRNCGTVVRNIDSNKKRVICSQCGETIKIK
ncbi:hypothetical protein ES703_73043 [subsurface metagenome]